MVVRWLVAAVAAAGCAAVPAGPADRPLLTVDTSSGRVSTTSDAPIQFTLTFSDRSPRMPDSLVLDGVNRIASGTCPTEAGVGIGLYPALNVSAPGLGGDDATGSLVVELAGPTVARVTVNWATSFECNLAQQQGHGSSTFTVFPNGRIVRHDLATPSTTALAADLNPCGCASDTNFFFTSYWSFSKTQSVMPDGTLLLDRATAGCIVYSNHMIGMAWPDEDTRVLSDAYTAFIHDWAADTPNLPPTERELTSAILLSKQTAPASCAAVVADLEDFPIMVAGSAVITDDNGIYVDRGSHDGQIDITAQRRVPRGFAVSLDIGGFAEVSRSTETDDGWFATQPDGDRTVFWFRDGLGVGETISIDPR